MRYPGLNLHFIFLIIVVFYVICSGKRPFAGPFDVVFKSFYKCGNLTQVFGYNTKFYKINRTHNAYRTNMTSPAGLKDTMHVTIDFSVYGNGGWQDNFLQFRLNRACSDLQNLYPNLLVTIFKASGKTFRGCPTTDTLLEVKDWVYTLKPAVPVFPYGRYKTVTRLYEKEKILACFVFELDMVPEVNPKPRITGRRRKH